MHYESLNVKLSCSTPVVVAVLLMGLSFDSTTARIIRVPADRTTIQSAINIANSYDTVLVSDGIYRGHENRDIDLLGKHLVVTSVNGPLTTIIDLQGAGTAFYLRNGENRSTLIEGFTARNCSNSNGAAVHIHASHPTFRNCRFENNHARDGGAVWAEYADSLEFIDCVFSGDSAVGYGGAVYISNRPATFTRCIFDRNTAYRGGGIYTLAPVILDQCTFVDNFARDAGAAIYRTNNLILSNSIIAFNKGKTTQYADGYQISQTVTCTNVFGNIGGNWQGLWASDSGINGNVSVNPLFCDTASGEYTLRPYSPCAAAHSLCGEVIGALDESECRWILPDPANLNIEGEEAFHIKNQIPTFRWDFFDTVGSQLAVEIQVGSDANWDVSELWQSGPINQSTPQIAYAGFPLTDGSHYYYRIRLNNGTNWGSWSQGTFVMNTAPSVPITTWPVNDGPIHISAVNLSIQNSSDAENDQLTYQFEICSDTVLPKPIVALEKPTGLGDSTVAGPLAGLTAGVRYFWRVRAFDQFEYSPWSAFEPFNVIGSARKVRVPQDAPSIQRAIAASGTGDTIIVAPGTYVENIVLRGKQVLLESEEGASHTTLRPLNATLPVVSIEQYLNWTTATIRGFTITGTSNAPGIYCTRASPVISQCVISDCKHNGDGGGIRIDNSRIEVTDCIIRGNSSTASGGGIGGRVFQGRISGNVFDNNEGLYGAGIGVTNFAYPLEDALLINKNIVNANVGTGQNSAGIFVFGGVVVISNNTVVGNTHGIIYEWGGSSYARISNNIVCNNQGNGIVLNGSNLPTYNNIWQNGIAQQNRNWNGISVDPLFVDPENSNFALLPESPCIDRGDPDSTYFDPDGSRSDIGAVPYQHELPMASRLNFGSVNPERMVNHTPTLYWSYLDSAVSTQHRFEIQVSDTLLPFVPNMWSPAVFESADTMVEYSGATLQDGRTYYFRLRLNDGTGWGSWVYSHFRMNNRPGIPVAVTPVNDWKVFAGATQLFVDTVYNPDSDTITYDFQVFAVNDTLSSPIQTLDSQWHHYSGKLDPLEVNQQYWWRARSFDGYEHSTWSNTSSFITRANTTLRVPADFATIQEALVAASSNDSVVVAPGTYRGNGNRDLQWYEKNIYLYSSGGQSATIIDCQGSVTDPHRAFYFPSMHDAAITDGFTIQNGYAVTGGAVAGRYANVTIRNCRFQYNHATSGGAVGLGPDRNYFYPNFINCVFYRNSADQYGGAIYQAVGTLSKCTFQENSARYGGACASIGAMTIISKIDSCTFAGNTAYRGSAIWGDGTGFWPPPVVTNTLFARNGSSNEDVCLVNVYGDFTNCTFYGNVGLVTLEPYLNPRFVNCLIAFNRLYLVSCGGGGWDSPPQANPTLDHCNVFGNVYSYAGCIAEDANVRGNISADPRFCDTTGLDFSLAANSPCIGTGLDGRNIGAFGTGCIPTGIGDENATLPLSFNLSQNYPNPFNPVTKIQYSVPRRVHVMIEIFNVLGERVQSLLNETKIAGSHQIVWDGRNAIGMPVSSGIYFYRIHAGEFVETRKMLLLK